jgi:hypothetical protein
MFFLPEQIFTSHHLSHQRVLVTNCAQPGLQLLAETSQGCRCNHACWLSMPQTQLPPAALTANTNFHIDSHACMLDSSHCTAIEISSHHQSFSCNESWLMPNLTAVSGEQHCTCHTAIACQRRHLQLTLPNQRTAGMPNSADSRSVGTAAAVIAAAAGCVPAAHLPVPGRPAAAAG